MTRRDLAWRLAGMALLGGAGGTSLVHRHVLAAAANRPASAIEIGLGLASFILASFGMLLIINGPHLRDEWRARRIGARQHGAGQPEDTRAAPARRPRDGRRPCRSIRPVPAPRHPRT